MTLRAKSPEVERFDVKSRFPVGDQVAHDLRGHGGKGQPEMLVSYCIEQILGAGCATDSRQIVR